MWQEILLFLLLIKLFNDLTKGKCNSRKRLVGKTVLITGANSGIGEATARDLARRGAQVILASRRTQVTERVKQEIIDETGNEQIIVKELDVSSSESIRRFSDDIHKSVEKIDILIHNAGIVSSPEGGIKVLKTNLYGPFLLTHLLIDLVKRSNDGRIIFVSSIAGLHGKTDFSQIDKDGDVPNVSSSYKYYGISKYGMIIMANELALRLKEFNISVNSLNPGLVLTPIFDQLPAFIKIFNTIGKIFLAKTEEEGAQTTIYLAVDDAGRENTGKFVIDCYSFNTFTGEQHVSNAKVLWSKCKGIMNLKGNDPKI